MSLSYYSFENQQLQSISVLVVLQLPVSKFTNIEDRLFHLTKGEKTRKLNFLN